LEQDRPLVHVASPQDEEIERLGTALNQTYIPYGAQGAAGQARQQAQDGNAAKANKSAAVNRALSKGNRLYSNESWDLVDAVKSRQVDLEAMKAADLPPALQGLGAGERRAGVGAQARERARPQARRQGLESRRQRRRADAAPETLDEVMMQGLRDQAACRGFALQ